MWALEEAKIEFKVVHVASEVHNSQRNETHCYMCVCPVFLSVSDSNAIIGRQSWIMFAIITVEVLIEIKFGWDIITTPVPWYFLTAWAVLLVAIFIWAAWKFTVPFKEMPIIGPYYRRYILNKED